MCKCHFTWTSSTSCESEHCSNQTNITEHTLLLEPLIPSCTCFCDATKFTGCLCGSVFYIEVKRTDTNIYDVEYSLKTSRTSFASSCIFLAQVSISIVHLDIGIFVHFIPALLKLNQTKWELNVSHNFSVIPQMLSWITVWTLTMSLQHIPLLGLKAFLWSLSCWELNNKTHLPSPRAHGDWSIFSSGSFYQYVLYSNVFPNILLLSSEKNSRSMMLSAMYGVSTVIRSIRLDLTEMRRKSSVLGWSDHKIESLPCVRPNSCWDVIWVLTKAFCDTSSYCVITVFLNCVMTVGFLGLFSHIS